LKYSVVFLTVLCFWQPLFAAAQISVDFQPTAAVSGSRILLADIARIKPQGPETEALGQLPVAVAPSPGNSKELYVVSVINSLRNRPEVAGVDWQGSKTIVVQRKNTTLTQEQIQQIIADYLKENSARLPGTDYRFSILRAPKMLTLPAGKLSWKVTPSRPGIIGSTNFAITLSVDDKPAGTCVVRGKLEAVSVVVVAATTLHKGEMITEANIVMQRQDIGENDKPFRNREQILGMQVARTINAGTILQQEQIVLPAVVKHGEMVKIFARKGALQLSTSGVTKADGRPGEIIAVKNISSNKIVQCRVDGPGTVSVEF
jgi:flagellar basal body P-ring formation protein FlgA